MTTVVVGPPLVVALVLLVVIATTVYHLGGGARWWSIPWAAARAAVQLAILALIIGALVRNWYLIFAFLLLMTAVAAHTAAGRVRERPHLGNSDAEDGADDHGARRRGRRAHVRAAAYCAVPVAGATFVIVAALLVAGIVAPNGLAVVPVAGILLGNAMNLTSLTGRRAHDELRQRAGEVEAMVALGFEWTPARLEICRDAAASALVPAIDSTRTVGMVTIPGAFVGMVLGGASPEVAGFMQLFVLLGILAVGVVAMAVTTRLVGTGRL